MQKGNRLSTIENEFEAYLYLRETLQADHVLMAGSLRCLNEKVLPLEGISMESSSHHVLH